METKLTPATVCRCANCGGVVEGAHQCPRSQFERVVFALLRRREIWERVNKRRGR